MDLNPQAVSDAQFRVVRKGYDPEQVRPLLAQAADSLRSAQNRAATAEGRVGAAEARATDAEARAIDAEARAKAALQAASVAQESAGEDPEQLRRALLTAQKAADATVADAKAEAAATVTTAKDEAKKITTDARASAARMVADAETAARAAHAAELERVKAEMVDLSSQRDQLRGDADLLAAHLVAQRERVGGSIEALREVLARPTVLEPLPVPEKGDPTRVGTVAGSTGTGAASAAPADDADDVPSASVTERSTGADGVQVPGAAADAAVEAADDGDEDVAGELASLAGDEGAAATATATSTDAGDAFFEQGEPFVDDRWKGGS